MVNFSESNDAINKWKEILVNVIDSLKPFVWTTMAFLCFVFLVISIMKTLTTLADTNLASNIAAKKAAKTKIISIWVFFALGCILVLLAPTIMETMSILWNKDLGR